MEHHSSCKITVMEHDSSSKMNRHGTWFI